MSDYDTGAARRLVAALLLRAVRDVQGGHNGKVIDAADFLGSDGGRDLLDDLGFPVEALSLLMPGDDGALEQLAMFETSGGELR